MKPNRELIQQIAEPHVRALGFRSVDEANLFGFAVDGSEKSETGLGNKIGELCLRAWLDSLKTDTDEGLGGETRWGWVLGPHIRTAYGHILFPVVRPELVLAFWDLIHESIDCPAIWEFATTPCALGKWSHLSSFLRESFYLGTFIGRNRIMACVYANRGVEWDDTLEIEEALKHAFSSIFTFSVEVHVDKYFYPDFETIYQNDFVCYHFHSPLDCCGWELLASVDVAKRWASPAFTDYYNSALLALKQTGWWDGDIRSQGVVSFPSVNGGVSFGFLVKQNNNGDTFLLSPCRLPYLEESGATIILCDKSLDGIDPTALRPPVYSADNTDEFIEWNGLYCRSEPERVIAEAMAKRGLDFHLNAGGRFKVGDEYKTREPDFVVYLGNGRVAHLEIDGRQYHASAADDHNRDRMFRKLGVQVERFPATECMADPDRVVAEFLEVVTKQ